SLRANKGTHEWASSRPTGEKRGETPEPKGVRRACKAHWLHDRHHFLRREVGSYGTLSQWMWELGNSWTAFPAMEAKRPACGEEGRGSRVAKRSLGMTQTG